MMVMVMMIIWQKQRSSWAFLYSSVLHTRHLEIQPPSCLSHPIGRRSQFWEYFTSYFILACNYGPNVLRTNINIRPSDLMRMYLAIDLQRTKRHGSLRAVPPWSYRLFQLSDADPWTRSSNRYRHLVSKRVLLDNALFFFFYRYYTGGCLFKFGITFVAGCRYVFAMRTTG